MLALMVGVIQITLGLLKMGFLVRFVPHSVMTGFLNGVAILIILGQLRDFTGYQSQFSNRVVQAVDMVFNVQQIILPMLVVGLTTVALIVILDRIRVTSQFSFILAMIFSDSSSTLRAVLGSRAALCSSSRSSLGVVTVAMSSFSARRWPSFGSSCASTT